MKTKTACFTGHRTIPDADLPLIKQRLDKIITEFVNRGVVYFGSGGAIGFDTLAALAVINARENNPAVKLILVLPCRDMDARWREPDRKMHQYLLGAADKVVCLSERYFDGCMEARNKHLVKHSCVCIAYMTHERSGTAQTVRLARKQGLTVINLSNE